MGVGIVVLIGSLGLAVDLARAYVAKNEAQAFTDAAALAAAAQLNNTLSGITKAKAAVDASANRWNFGSRKFSGYQVEFSTNRTVWTANPGSGTNVRYVRVTAANNSLAAYFATVFKGPQTMNVAARSMAGIEAPTVAPQGVFPFAPLAKSSTPPHFGYNFGDELTLLWPSSVNSDGQSVKLNNLCQADRNQAALQAVRDGVTAERGYIQETSTSAIAAAIEDDYMNYTVTIGQPVYRSGGVKTTAVYQSLNARSEQDTMPKETDYNRYIANHDASPMRRIVIVPIISDAVGAVALGFVKVFLPPKQPHNPNNSKCAMYIGPADTPTGNGADGANLLRLLE
jgi:Flp pilus assembly protein TadG